MIEIRPLYLFISFFTLCGCTNTVEWTKPSLEKSKNWVCYYGESLSNDLFQKLDMAILDPDTFHFQQNQKWKVPPYTVGYLSVGEIEEYRGHWNQVANEDFILESNPNWPGSYYVDIRSETWQSLLLDQVIPAILKKGYRGLFLDTLDTAEYLEWKDPKRFEGSLKAMEDFVLKIREKFPRILIITNNALPLLDRWGDRIDGALVEDLYTHYNFEKKAYEKAPAQESEQKETILKSYREKFNRPVFVILYAQPQQEKLIRWAAQNSKEADFYPYVATIALEQLGQIPEGIQ